MRSVLVTRPQPAADELADKLRREGFEVYLAPMTEYAELNVEIPDTHGYQAIVFTSAQAVAIFAKHSPERLPIVFAVGEATAQAASKTGFHRVYSADGGGEDLLTLIRSKKADLHLQRILHICGEDTAQDLETQLRDNGIAVERIPVYKAKYIDALPADVGRALAEGDVSTVTLFSARTAANFSRLLQKDDLKGVSADLEAVCLSDRVAAEIRGLPWRAVRVARNPHLEAVLDILRTKEEGRSANAPLPADPVIEAFGGLRPLANRLDITASTVQGWKKRGVIPETRVDAIISAARAANIDLDRLWTERGAAMSDDDQTRNDDKTPAAGAPKAPQTGAFQDRRRSTDRRVKRALVDHQGVVRSDSYVGPERRTGVDRRSYESRQQDRIKKEKWRFVNRTVVTTSFFTICILYGAAFLLAPEIFEVKKQAKQMEQLQAQYDALNKKYAQMQTPAPPPPESSIGSMLSNQIGHVQDTIDTVKSTASAVGTVAQTAIENTQTGKALQQMLNILTTLNKMNSTKSGREKVDVAMEKLKVVIAASGANPNELSADIAAARKEDPTLDKVLGNVDSKDVAAAAMLLALNEYRNNVNSGRPFQSDLLVMRKLAGNDPQLQASLSRLAPYAESGVLSRDKLQKEFGDVAFDIVMAKAKGQDMSVKKELLDHFDKLIQVRKVNDIKGDGVDATVAKAQLLLNQGDVKGAIKLLQTLDGAPAAEAQPFIKDASGTLTADETTNEMTGSILQQIQSQTGYDLQSLFEKVTGGGGGGAAPIVSPGATGGGGADLGPSE